SIDEAEAPIEILTSEAQKDLETILKRTHISPTSENELEEIDLTSANTFKPSAMGITFFANFINKGNLIIEVQGARYKKIQSPKRSHSWWLRVPLKLKYQIPNDVLSGLSGSLKNTENYIIEHAIEDLNLSIEIYT